MALRERVISILPKLTLFMTVNLVILGFLFVGFGREYWRNIQIEREIAEMQDENARLEGEKLRSLSLISDLSSEYYLESEARTKQNMGKPGEELIIVDLPEAPAPVGEVKGVATDEGISNPTRWMYFFFNHDRFEAMSDL